MGWLYALAFIKDINMGGAVAAGVVKVIFSRRVCTHKGEVFFNAGL